MKFAGRVGRDLWLGVAGAGAGARPAPSLRGARDRRASAEGERTAVAAAGLYAGEYAVSRSHSLGSGAAVVGPTGIRVGVDLVWIDRVTPRHADAILSPAERSALAPAGTLAPAMAWALKEAGAKASGDPQRQFPYGVIIERRQEGLGVRVAGRWFKAGWRRFGGVLCVWVWEGGDDHPRVRVASATSSGPPLSRG